MGDISYLGKTTVKSSKFFNCSGENFWVQLTETPTIPSSLNLLLTNALLEHLKVDGNLGDSDGDHKMIEFMILREGGM